MTTASGSFEVKLTPQPDPDGVSDSTIGRLAVEKQFHGELEGTSKGQMLSTRTGVDGSAGYVAMERVVGTLAGRRGSFTLQHSGTMNRGAPTLSLTVVPDSGTGELEGLSGSMQIIVADGKHAYVFEYVLPG